VRCDCFAAQRESENEGQLTNGGVGDRASAIEGAVKGVVEALGIFTPAIAAVVDAVAVIGFDVLLKVLVPVVAMFAIGVGGVDAITVHRAAQVGGELDIPGVAVGVAPRVDLGDRARL